MQKNYLFSPRKLDFNFEIFDNDNDMQNIFAQDDTQRESFVRPPPVSLKPETKQSSQNAVQQPQIPQGIIHMLDGKYYMDVDFILQNPQFAAQVAR